MDRLDWVPCNSDGLALVAIGGLLLGLFAFKRYSARRKQPVSTEADLSKKRRFGAPEEVQVQKDLNKFREPGEWTPQTFDYPSITPCPHPLSDIRPVPYRPFRWGEYHITMGIRSMPWDEWIELDQQYTTYESIRAFRIKTRGEDAVRILPSRHDNGVDIRGGGDAAKELLYEIGEYLSRRHPSCFVVTRHTAEQPWPQINGLSLGWEGLPPIHTIIVVATGKTYQFDGLEGEEAMRVAALLIQDDIAIMIEGSDGRYYFQAGAICVPGFWRMRDKIGMPLDEIHITGNVPQYKEKLQTSMERFFKRMPLEKPVVRNNYFIQVVKPLKKSEDGHTLDDKEETTSDVDPEELGWSDSTNGPEDAFAHGHGHARRQAPYLAPQTLRLRTERQTLRRLPRTGAIIFGIRTYLFKIEELADEPGVPGRLASSIRSWPDDVSTYKGRKMYRDVLLGYLDERAREQENRIGAEPALQEDHFPL
ncbi:hypothetical protein SERLA73DRAFT_176926 [Serpula lacrymans var. lacrymans S7.3]|uniref:Uncharacterized protein n=2 Tax=Serpula lacrymans var. lacrymans TaxID=341189 RepID=F8PQF4_SERL3|nr:uncharacterized protein SERLADRAFT_460255 [Serpula lacrymans var. lacrymans S7.9]EGO01567.1 hypothetical protein SERLA73DRAFT_176926 [Serpula lacrymans var. lacrymans S7.3]EGO27222.1 hypothetical protein SERLADRAFT_460255 [Serpula lacrymans var. lacrymans S7.9]